MHVLGRLLDPTLVETLRHLAMGAWRVVHGTTIGLHKSPVKGASVEFRQHRLYVPGDEPRRIDWRVLARSDKAFVKEYDEETNLRATVVLDASGSMNYGKSPARKFDTAARVAAGLAYLMLAQTDAVGLAIANDAPESFVAPSGASSQLTRILTVLGNTTPAGPTRLDNTLLRVADRIDRRSLLIIISDFFQPVSELTRGLARLHHDRHELVLLRMLHPDERTFPFATWAKFEGLESEAPKLLETAAARKMYLANFAEHERQLTQAARATGADLLHASCDRAVVDAILAVVRRSNA